MVAELSVRHALPQEMIGDVVARTGGAPLNPVKFAQSRNSTSHSAFYLGALTLNATRQKWERTYGQNFSLGSGILLFSFSGQRTGKLRSI
jgi:hypothetical protein